MASGKEGEDQEPELGPRYNAVAAHETVVADLHEAGWQDVLEEAPDKLESIDGGPARSVTLFFAVGEGDLPVLGIDDPGVGDGHPEDIGGKIFEGRFAVAHGLRVNVPVDLPNSGINGANEFLPAHLVPELGAEDLGEGLDRKIKVVGRRQPLVAVRGQAAGRDENKNRGQTTFYVAIKVKD